MAMVTIRHETPFDIAAREALLDEAFGECRFAKTAQRLRDGRLPSEGLSFVAMDNERVIGTVRLWDVTAGPKQSALLLGPIAVACDRQGHGVGAALLHHTFQAFKQRGFSQVGLTVESGRPNSYAFYQKIGMKMAYQMIEYVKPFRSE